MQVNEGDSVTITLTLSGLTDGAFASDTGAFGGTATNGQDYDGPSETGMGVRRVIYESRTLNPSKLSEGLTYTITDDSAAEPDETITLAVPTFNYLSGSDTITRGDPLTITIRANDGYTAPAVAPAPTTDNPAARAARVKAPAAAIARGIGQLAADAVQRRIGGGDAGRIGLWTGGGGISTDGERDNIAYDGDASALHIGVDRRWRGGRIGFSVAQSGADMDFGADNLDADVTSVHPYLSRAFGDKRFWLTVGIGSGDAELTEGNAAPIKTDLSVTTAALGLSIAPRDGVELSAAAVHTRAKLDAATAGARTLPSTTADATRLSAAAELSRELATDARPFLTVKVRHDSGDDEQGTAGDLGGGVEWETPTVFFRLEGVAHVGGDGGEEQRFGLTLRRSFGELGLSLNLAADDSGVDTARLLHGEWRF